MAHSRTYRSPFGLGVILICFVAVLGLVAPVRATAGARPAAGPTIRADPPSMAVPGFVAIHGAGFTPGAVVEVTVLLLDQSGRRFQQTAEVKTTLPRSVVSHYTGDGRPAGDPTYNTPGGLFLVGFDHVCGAQVTVQAYDRKTAAWSNWLAFPPVCRTAA